MLKMRIIPSGGLFSLSMVFYPPSFLELQLSLVQWSSVAPQGDIRLALLFLGVAKRQLLGCSASVEILQFCTCFLDNWHLKGRLWLLTVCPWPALGFSLKNCLFQPVTVWVFLCKVVVKSRPTAADVAESCIWTIWVEQLGGGLHTRALTLPCLQRFNSKTAFHWECFWVIV